MRDETKLKFVKFGCVAFIIMILAIFIVFAGSMCGLLDLGDSSSSTLTCRSCGRSYSIGTEDYRSIRSTNMCKNCYDNYRWAVGQ